MNKKEVTLLDFLNDVTKSIETIMVVNNATEKMKNDIIKHFKEKIEESKNKVIIDKPKH